MGAWNGKMHFHYNTEKKLDTELVLFSCLIKAVVDKIKI